MKSIIYEFTCDLKETRNVVLPTKDVTEYLTTNPFHLPILIYITYLLVSYRPYLVFEFVDADGKRTEKTTKLFVTYFLIHGVHSLLYFRL